MKKTFSISAVFIIGFLGIMTAAEPAHADPRVSRYNADPDVVKYPPLPGTWRVDPPVIVCEGSMVTEEEVKNAMAWWNERGFYFGKLMFHEDPEKKCADDTPDGYIVIRPATPEILKEMAKETVAETHIYIHPVNHNVEFVVIYMVEEPAPQTMEHEFGHALGFKHYNKRGHMMHALTTRGGWGDYGLQRHARRSADFNFARIKQQKNQEK